MKKTLLTVCAALSLGAFAVDAPAEKADAKPLKVLMIGNSFSICCLTHTPAVAKDLGCPLDMVSLYIGGCSLERHCENIAVAATNETFRPYRITWNYASLADQKDVPFAGLMVECDWKDWNGKVHREKRVNIPEMLKADTWDIVTIQQASHFSWRPETYHPWGDNLVATIRELAPQAKIVVQETWSYPPWDGRLKDFGVDQVDMFARLHDAYSSFAAKHGLAVIPVGTAAEFCPDRNALFTKPDFHFNRHQGEYLQALVWTAKLFGVDVRRCAYKPASMDAARAEELKNAAMAAVTTPETTVRRAFRDARLTRGNLNILRQQPIDEAAWVWLPGDSGMAKIGEGDLGAHPGGGNAMEPKFLKFRNEFTVEAGDGTLVLDVSADERFYLTLDGAFVARGPNRSTVENWQYNTYVVTLAPGRHVLEAVVWKTGDKAPLAQLSWRGGFIVKANGAYDAKLTTGVAKGWKVGRLGGIRAHGYAAGAWGTGDQWEITGAGIQDAEPSVWAEAERVRGFAGQKGPYIYGGRTNGWMLYPSQLPDQTEQRVLPGKVVAVAEGGDLPWRGKHVFTAEEAAKTVDLAKPFTVPAGKKLKLAWDLGRYYCAYPEVTLSGGKGAKFSVNWTEATQRATDGLKGMEPNARDLIVGRWLDGFGDTFISDGRAKAVFTVPWFRCGKWVRIDVETQDEPLTVDAITLIDNRYPVEMESVFICDDASLQPIRAIAARAMQMCCHEMLFDCPFYEQQMYPGDTRVQLNVLSALSRDDRMIKRAIELYDLSTRDDGQCPFNWPTRGTQEGATYTLCYLLMYGDYVMNHADRDWLKARLPGLRRTMGGMELYENADGLLENLPGWSFMDWVPEWRSGVAPNGLVGQGVNAEHNLFWILAMQSAAKVERALGNELQAKYWEEKADRLKGAVVATFWSEERGLLSDIPVSAYAKKKPAAPEFSEHAQCLALLGDVLPADKAARAFGHLVADTDLKRCTVYFSYYLFETYFKFGRGDLFLKRLDLWRDYVKKGLTTTQEAPDTGKNGQEESRSDCHAWGAHPIWFMQTGLAGIKSAAPFFEKVLVAPCPGGLKTIHATHPHPKGWITVDLTFADGKATGTVETPVPGTFVFGDVTVRLKPGVNRL